MPVDESGTTSTWAFSRSPGRGFSCPVTASPLATFRCSQGTSGFQEQPGIQPVFDRGSSPRLDGRNSPGEHRERQQRERQPGPGDPPWRQRHLDLGAAELSELKAEREQQRV